MQGLKKCGEKKESKGAGVRSPQGSKMPSCFREGQWFLVQDHVTVPAAFTGLNARAVALPGDAHRDDFVDFDFPPSMEWPPAELVF